MGLSLNSVGGPALKLPIWGSMVVKFPLLLWNCTWVSKDLQCNSCPVGPVGHEGQPCGFDPPGAHKAHPHVFLPFLRQMRSWDLELVCLLLSTLVKWSRRSPCFVHHFWIRASFTLTLLLQGLTLFLVLHSLLIWSAFQFVLLSWFQVFLFLLPSLFFWLCILFSMLQIFFLRFSSIPCHSCL